MDIFVLYSLLIVSLSVFRLSDTRARARSFGILNLTQTVRMDLYAKWKCSREFVTFINKDMTVNWIFFCAEDAHARVKAPDMASHYANALTQWFSTFFSTGPHYGPSASLTGRTHVIYILRHQYKPTRFIILFIA